MDDTAYGRPAAELIASQRRSKERWRRQQTQLPLREKIRLLLDLQATVYPILRQRRTPRPWEHPWDIEP